MTFSALFKRRGPRLSALIALSLVAIGFSGPAAAVATVVELEIKGGIGVASADYLISGIEHAEEIGA
ncbi:MAG: hypothetical protein ACR2RD_02530, partial [Woeseiaceae bacterium]